MNTLNLLVWAQATSREDEVVGMFWNKLCETVEVASHSTAAKVFDEFRLYGSNSIVNHLWRDHEGVPYDEIAYDVAKLLGPWFDRNPFRKGDLKSCETFVLKKMGVDSDALDEITRAIRQKSIATTFEPHTSSSVAKVGVNVVGRYAAQQAAEYAGQQAAQQVLTEAAKQAAKKAAKVAAKKAAAQAARKAAETMLANLITAINVILIAWVVVDFAGPARRKTIPGVTYIALLRKLHEAHTMNF